MSKYSSILASLHPVQHGTHLNRVSKYQEYEHEWNISAIQCPIDIKDIGKFEHQNNISINVSVNRYEDKQIFPLRITTKTVAIHYVNLLCITAGWKISSRICERIEQTGIKSITNNRKHRTYFCWYCLHGCASEEVLKKHLKRCKLHGAQKIKFPEVGDKKGAWKSQVYKSRIPAKFTFCHLRGFQKHIM